ncbi:MAG TPA: hypothetical protein VFB20_07070 [Burkholderiales bacterium]|nr:hypothetical protein [Burkholderiales bacterium]
MTTETPIGAAWALIVGLGLLSAGCATSSGPATASPTVTVLDNVGGGSQASVVRVDNGAVRIEAASRAGDCVLREFLAKPGEQSSASQSGIRSVPVEEFQGDRAIVHFRPAEPTTIVASYVHTVLVESGNQTEPENEADATGSGEVQAGRVLLNGYRFDHYDFSHEVTGPGGASASVKEAPRPGSQQAFLRIRWSYDPYSRVTFSWKIYATGPCNASP